MGLGDEYELEPVEEETGNRAEYEAVTDAEDGEIEVPEKYKMLIGPVGAGKSRGQGSIFEHEERRKLDKELAYKLLEKTEDEDVSFRGHYHNPGRFWG